MTKQKYVSFETKDGLIYLNMNFVQRIMFKRNENIIYISHASASDSRYSIHHEFLDNDQMHSAINNIETYLSKSAIPDEENYL